MFSNKIDSLCFSQAYEEIYALPFPSIDWLQYPHVTDHTIFNAVIQDHFGRQASVTEINTFQDRFMQLLETGRKQRPEDFLAVPHAKETVDWLLSREEYAVAIGTGGWYRPACLKLRHVKIPVESLFVSAADNQPTREDITREAIRLASDAHGVFEDIVYIGDAVWDVRTTRNLAMKFIGIRRKGDFEMLTKQGAQHVMQDFSDKELFLEALEKAVPPVFV